MQIQISYVMDINKYSTPNHDLLNLLALLANTNLYFQSQLLLSGTIIKFYIKKFLIHLLSQLRKFAITELCIDVVRFRRDLLYIMLQLYFQVLSIPYEVTDCKSDIISTASIRDYGCIFVLQSFEGIVYEQLHKLAARIMGPSVLIQCANQNQVRVYAELCVLLRGCASFYRGGGILYYMHLDCAVFKVSVNSQKFYK